jgi:hypothetical protein
MGTTAALSSLSERPISKRPAGDALELEMRREPLPSGLRFVTDQMIDIGAAAR